MYRAVIEHPEWIPDDWEKRLDLRAGSEQGRIYRVYPGRQEAPADPAARPARHGRPRRRARQPQRLAARHGPAAALAPARSGRDRAAASAGRRSTKRPKTRVQAIWTLADLGGLDEPSALAGLDDPDPRVRESVIAAVVAAAARQSRLVAEALIRAGRRRRRACPVPGRAGAGQLGRSSRRRGTGATGAARWERPLDASRDPELGDCRT